MILPSEGWGMVVGAIVYSLLEETDVAIVEAVPAV